jgi:hypothetical protein
MKALDNRTDVLYNGGRIGSFTRRGKEQTVAEIVWKDEWDVWSINIGKVVSAEVLEDGRERVGLAPLAAQEDLAVRWVHIYMPAADMAAVKAAQNAATAAGETFMFPNPPPMEPDILLDPTRDAIILVSEEDAEEYGHMLNRAWAANGPMTYLDILWGEQGPRPGFIHYIQLPASVPPYPDATPESKAEAA